jgi:hypothetical protein
LIFPACLSRCDETPPDSQSDVGEAQEAKQLRDENTWLKKMKASVEQLRKQGQEIE